MKSSTERNEFVLECGISIAFEDVKGAQRKIERVQFRWQFSRSLPRQFIHCNWLRDESLVTRNFAYRICEGNPACTCQQIFFSFANLYSALVSDKTDVEVGRFSQIFAATLKQIYESWMTKMILFSDWRRLSSSWQSFTVTVLKGWMEEVEIRWWRVSDKAGDCTKVLLS